MRLKMPWKPSNLPGAAIKVIFKLWQGRMSSSIEPMIFPRSNESSTTTCNRSFSNYRRRNKIGYKNGLLILLGIEEEDSFEDIQWLCNKVAKMRIFNDEAGL